MSVCPSIHVCSLTTLNQIWYLLSLGSLETTIFNLMIVLKAGNILVVFGDVPMQLTMKCVKEI